MILKTEENIRFHFSVPECRLTNQKYVVGLFTTTGYKDFYTGLTFFDNVGDTDIYIDNILRDYVYTNKINLTDYQTFRPSNYHETLNNVTLEPIENSLNQLLLSNIRVRLEIIKPDGQPSAAFQNKAITSIGNSFYEIANYTLKDPYNNSGTNDDIQNYSIYNKVLSHIPNKATKNYWLGLVFSVPVKYQRATAPLYLLTDTGKQVQVNYSDYGNYAVTTSLYFLQTSLQLRGGEIIYLGKDINEKVPVAIIDKCPTDFYVAYNTGSTWTSLPFKGNVSINSKSESTYIENYLGNKEKLQTRVKSTFSLYSDYTDRESFSTYMDILSARDIYVYDLKNDKGTWCVCTNTSYEGIPNHSNRPQYFHLNLEEIKYLKS